MRKITTDSLNWFWEKGIKPIKEKVENLKNTMDTMLKISEIVNNCVTDNPDLPLAAAQGKFLMDQITGLYSGIADMHVQDIILIRSIPTTITVPARSGGYQNIECHPPEGYKLISANTCGASYAQQFVCWLNCEMIHRNPNSGYVTYSYYNYSDQQASIEYCARFIFAKIS